MQARVFFMDTRDPIYAGSSDSLKGQLIDSEGKTLQTFGEGRDIIRVSVGAPLRPSAPPPFVL